MVKTLTVTEEAYERLASRKEPGESFSNVIIKITGKTSLMDILGILSDSEANKMEKDIASLRKGMNQRLQKTAEAIK